ncbi:MAG: hypothetical protein J6V15_07935, partial [Clostridia bacterium]|nr:hypothetical protein [Clostridia bacterium]
MKKSVRFLAVVMAIGMLLNMAAFAAPASEITGGEIIKTTAADPAQQSVSAVGKPAPEYCEYNEGVVLVKYDGELTLDMLAELDAVSAEPLYKGSVWHTVTLGETVTTAEAVTYLKDLDCFDAVDYDYIMKADGEVQSVDISGNTYAENLTYLETLGVKKGWES